MHTITNHQKSGPALIVGIVFLVMIFASLSIMALPYFY